MSSSNYYVTPPTYQSCTEPSNKLSPREEETGQIRPTLVTHDSSATVTTLALVILAIFFCFAGILAFSLNAPLPVGILAFVLSGSLLIAAIFYGFKSLRIKEVPAVAIAPEGLPTAFPVTTIEGPKPIKTQVNLEKLLQYPKNWNLETIIKQIKDRFTLDEERFPFGISKKDKRFTLKNKTLKDLTLTCYKGHPFDEKFEEPGKAAFVLQVSPGIDYTNNLGRTLAVTGRIEKNCWDKIKSKAPLGKDGHILHSGDSVSGPWFSEKSTQQLPGAHLILLNPPSVESLITEEQAQAMKGRALTLKDVDRNAGFSALVMAYMECFQTCIDHGLTSIQLDILGLNNFYSGQDDYEAWCCGCQLAFLESVRLLEYIPGGDSFKQICLQHYKEVPLGEAARRAFAKN